MPLDKPYTIYFLLVFNCNYVPILHRFEILPLISLNLKRSRDPEHIPFGESTIIDALLLLCINQHTKFKVPSCTDSKEMIGVYI